MLSRKRNRRTKSTRTRTSSRRRRKQPVWFRAGGALLLELIGVITFVTLVAQRDRVMDYYYRTDQAVAEQQADNYQATVRAATQNSGWSSTAIASMDGGSWRR